MSLQFFLLTVSLGFLVLIRAIRTERRELKARGGAATKAAPETGPTKKGFGESSAKSANHPADDRPPNRSSTRPLRRAPERVRMAPLDRAVTESRVIFAPGRGCIMGGRRLYRETLCETDAGSPTRLKRLLQGKRVVMRLDDCNPVQQEALAFCCPVWAYDLLHHNTLTHTLPPRAPCTQPHVHFSGAFVYLHLHA